MDDKAFEARRRAAAARAAAAQSEADARRAMREGVAAAFAPADLMGRTEIAPGPPAAVTPMRTEIAAAPPVMTQAKPVAAADALELSQGIKVAHFELIRELGRGGMGQVYLARDTKLGRLVALKFLGVRSPELTERFLVEARATARCQHENIVVIYEADEWEGQPYMALEYLEGEPLSSVIKDRTVSPRRAVELMTPVVRALARAHEYNIVHRDLKPDNIFVTRDGSVKVLDFGIAKLFESDDGGGRVAPELLAHLHSSNMTQEGGIVGTMPYMSPEQWGADAVDHRTDFWALGIIFWEMLSGRHPLDPLTPQRLWTAAAERDTPMPRIADAVPEVPAALEQLIDRCLAKHKAQRFDDARELLDVLERLSPGRFGRRLDEGESPYPGMSAFQEADADRFFGRSGDVAHMAQRLREQPLIAVVGPSGVGKSSFVRAGVVPSLRASGDEWEVLIARPGRDPIAGLASLLHPLTSTGSADAQTKMREHQALVDRLATEPGLLGTLLRSRARSKRSNILLFVDQFEELYTLVDDPAARQAFTASLAGMADDASAPLRVVISMRSDFLDRAAEDRLFMDQLTRGLMFLAQIDRDGMREALIQPPDMVGYRFETDAIVDDMLDALADTPGALPLLQFSAAKLWDARDRSRQLLTATSYEALGGVAGALATHADEVFAGLSADQQRLGRAILMRLVTTDGTRAIVDVEELRGLSPDSGAVEAVVDYLVRARLLVVQSRGDQDGPAVEIVHESLISSWPSLRRWLEDSHEDSAFIEQLRSASRQWDAKGRAIGLLWSGEAADEARRFERRFKGELSDREREFLTAVLTQATRAARRKRRLVIGAFVFLIGLVAVAAVALVFIRRAQTEAESQKVLAEQETERARSAEAETKRALDTIQQQDETIVSRERERDEAQVAADEAAEKAETAEAAQAMTYEQLEDALAAAKKEKRKAEKAQQKAEKAQRTAEDANEEIKRLAEADRKAKKDAEARAAREKAKREELEKELSKLSTKLK